MMEDDATKPTQQHDIFDTTNLIALEKEILSLMNSEPDSTYSRSTAATLADSDGRSLSSVSMRSLQSEYSRATTTLSIDNTASVAHEMLPEAPTSCFKLSLSLGWGARLLQQHHHRKLTKSFNALPSLDATFLRLRQHGDAYRSDESDQERNAVAVVCCIHPPVVMFPKFSNPSSGMTLASPQQATQTCESVKIPECVEIFGVAVSPNGEYVAVTAHERDSLLVLHLTTASMIKIACPIQPFGIAFSSNSRFLFVGFGQGLVIIYSAETLKKVKKIKFKSRFNQAVTDIAVSSCGSYFVAAMGKKAIVTSVTGKVISVLREHEADVVDILILRQHGTIVTSTNDGAVIIWHKGHDTYIPSKLLSCSRKPNTLVLHPSGDVFAVLTLENSQIEFYVDVIWHWKLETVVKLNNPFQKIESFGFINDMELLLLADNGEFILKHVDLDQREAALGKYNGKLILACSSLPATIEFGINFQQGLASLSTNPLSETQKPHNNIEDSWEVLGDEISLT